MNSIINQVMLEYSWDHHYAKSVAFEYMRFLELRNENKDLSPSDDIDRFWHQHILNTKHYFTYCFKKFSQIVHHDPTDAYDQKARALRLKNTMKAYTARFGPIKKKKVWFGTIKTPTKKFDESECIDLFDDMLTQTPIRPTEKKPYVKKYTDGRKC